MRVLKIKDNIDLKELEKYGFKKESDRYHYQGFDYQIDISRFTNIKIVEFFPYNNHLRNIDICIIYDLIKEDMIEVVEVED